MPLPLPHDRLDSDLLVAMARGDESAAAALHARIGPRLLAYARALLRDDALAEDAVQQAWLRTLTRPRSELQSVRAALPWLVRMTHGLARNALRERTRAARRDRIAAHPESRPSIAPLGDSHSALLAAMDHLTDDQREVLLLRHVATLTFDQIAWSLEENRSTIASRYRAAHDRLRSVIAHPHDPAPAPTPTLRVPIPEVRHV